MPLHIGNAGFEQFRIVRCNLDQSVHIVVILARAVHLILDIYAGGNCTVHLFKVRTGVIHITDAAAAPNGGVRNLGQYFFA